MVVLFERCKEDECDTVTTSLSATTYIAISTVPTGKVTTSYRNTLNICSFSEENFGAWIRET